MTHRPIEGMPPAFPTPAGQPRRTLAYVGPLGSFGAVLLLWVTFFGLIAFSPDTLMGWWERFTDWRLIVQVLVGIVLLPWVVATWAWQSDWATVLRVIVIATLAIVTLSAFTPREE